jgi:hypothetical protein
LLAEKGKPDAKDQSPEPFQIRPSARTDASRPPVSSTEVAYQWILKFAAITGKVAERVQQDIWAEALSDIPADRLNAACERLIKTWRFPNLPMPGDVRALLDSAEAGGSKLQAEEEWQKALRLATRFWHPDTGMHPQRTERCALPNSSREQLNR